MAADRGRLSFLHRIFLLTPCLALCACLGGTVNPVTGETDWLAVDEAQELEMGRQVHQQLIAEFGVYPDQELQRYVTWVGQSLVPHTHRPNLDYQFTVLDHEVVNAFALPGYVYVTRGILAMFNSEAELAAILGHELAHITARHSARQMGQEQLANLARYVVSKTSKSDLLQDAANVLTLAHVRGYGRDAEREADRLGTQYMAQAGYDPKAMPAFFRTLKNYGEFERRRTGNREPFLYHLFATHPDTDERLADTAAQARRVASGAKEVHRDRYLKQIDGLMVGPSEKNGIVHGQNLYHGLYDYMMSFPRGWSIDNGIRQLVASAPDEAAKIRLILYQRLQGQSACDFMRKNFEYRPPLRTYTHPGGYQGCQAWVRDEGGFVDTMVLEQSRDVMLLTVVQASSVGWAQHRAAIEGSLRSIRPLRVAERALARSPRLKIIRAMAGDTYRGYAAGAQWDTHPEEMLRLFNMAYPSGEPVAGASVKVVEP